MIVAASFEGALVVSTPDAPLTWRPGAKDFVLAVAAAGGRLVVVSAAAVQEAEVLPGDAEDWARTGRVPAATSLRWTDQQRMRAFLQIEGAWPLVRVWEGQGMPPCQLYVDVWSEGPDFIRLARELGFLVPVSPPNQP